MYWNGVSGASDYGLYISQYPYGSSNIIYSNSSLSGTSTNFVLPSGTLSNGVKYCWNMNTENSSATGARWEHALLPDLGDILHVWCRFRRGCHRSELVPRNRRRAQLPAHQSGTRQKHQHLPPVKYVVCATTISSTFTFGLYNFADPDEYANSSLRVTDPTNSTMVVTDAQLAANTFYNIAGPYLTANHLLPALDLEDDRNSAGTAAGEGGFSSPNAAPVAGLPQSTWSEIAQWVAAWTTQFHLDAPSVPAPILYMPMGYAKNISPQLINSFLASSISYPLWVVDINKQPNVDPNPSIGSWPTGRLSSMIGPAQLLLAISMR